MFSHTHVIARIDLAPSSEILTTVLDKLESWWWSFVEMLPNLGVAIVVVIAFGLLARLAGKLAGRAMRRWKDAETLETLASTCARLAVVCVGLFIALGILELDKTVTSLLAGVGVVGLALGFAFQDIAANFMSGVLMGTRRPIEVGDVVETNGVMGTVRHIDLRTTELETFQGQLVLIPNKDVLQNPLTNYTRLGRRRLDLACGVSYGTDLGEARSVAIAAIEAIDARDHDKPVQVVYTGFGDSSIDFELRFWLDLTQGHDFVQARSAAVMALKQAFDEADISIPFPIRTLDFGVEGGLSLAEVAPQLELPGAANEADAEADADADAAGQRAS